MSFIIAEPCVGTCDTACVEVCPVDCIHGPYDKEGRGEEAKVDGFVPKDSDSLYIDPEECIDCGACEPECPVEAILSDTEDGIERWAEINRKYSEIWPNINEKKEAPADAEKWHNVEDKFNKHFSEKPGK